MINTTVSKSSIIQDDIIYEPKTIILGIFGYTNKISEEEILDNNLIPILSELGRPPDKILLPSEGNSSIYIQSWAESMRIKTQIFQTDWQKNGRIAQIIRDDRIYKECTHALVFLSAKSQRLEKFAEKITLKGRIVFTSSYNQILTQLEMSCSELVLQQQKASKHVRKSDKGKVQMLLKFQKKE